MLQHGFRHCFVSLQMVCPFPSTIPHRLAVPGASAWWLPGGESPPRILKIGSLCWCEPSVGCMLRCLLGSRPCWCRRLLLCGSCGDVQRSAQNGCCSGLPTWTLPRVVALEEVQPCPAAVSRCQGSSSVRGLHTFFLLQSCLQISCESRCGECLRRV